MDSSVYDAAARLAKPFKTRYPLIEFEGNVGTLQEPDGHASQRYTHMRLSPLGEMTLEGIKKNSVNMIENYNGESLEPEYLTGLVPITLMNGTLGIGVGMASSIPPHNLREVAAAISHRIDNPTSSTKDLMRYIKGPDFPTGCSISNPDALLEAYETGRGSVKIKANYEVKTVDGRAHILVKEVPYLVNPMTMIVGKIQEMSENGYEFIEDILNHSDKKNGFLIEIVLTKGAPVFEVLEYILKETSIETSFGINLTTYLGDNKFERTNLLGLVDAYIAQNLSTNIRIANYDLEKLEARKFIVEGLILANDRIDEVIAIIKASDSKIAAIESLCGHIRLAQVQAEAVVNMRLHNLTKLDVNALRNELSELLQKIQELQEFLGSKELQLNAVKVNVESIAKKYGDDRRTRIKQDIEVGEVQEVTVFLNTDGEVYGVPTAELVVNRRNTKGKVFDNIVSFIETQNDKSIYILDADGFMTTVSVASIGVSSEMLKNSAGNLGVRGRAVQLLPIETSKYIVSLSAEGVIKKSLYSEYNTSKSFKVAKLRESDSIERVFFVNEGDRFLMVLSNNKYVYFNESEINITSINTIGTKAAALDMLSFDLVRDSALFVNGEGLGKQVLAKNLKESGRKSSGLACGEAVYAGEVRNEHVLIWGEDDKMIRLPEKSISVNLSVVAKGVILYNGNIAKILTR